MKLYFHPVSTTSRAVLLFLEDAKIPYQSTVVDLMTGEHLKEPFLKLNPSGLVPVLEDDGFVLTESSAILKYAAEKHDSQAYPKDLKQRARINERMDWFNSNLYKDWGYGLVYTQTFPHHVRPSEEAHRGTVEWGKTKCEGWLKTLDERILGSSPYLCGKDMTIADYFGAELLAAGDLIRVSYGRYPNVDRWMKSMRALPAWKKVNEATDGFAASLKDKPFVSIN